MSLKIGLHREEEARAYLTAQGLKWVESNYRCKMGEIDLIMRDGSTLVFVEVRARSGRDFGGALASVSYAKRQKILKTASLYLVVKQLYDKEMVRFDVLSLEGIPPQISWIKNAFGSEG